MKKYLFLLLSTCFLFACGGSSDEPSPNPEPVKPAVFCANMELGNELSMPASSEFTPSARIPP